MDAADYDYLIQWRWHACCNKRRNLWYAKRAEYLGNGSSKTISMQSVIMPVPHGFVVDHADGNGLNNSRSNLRQATHQQNKCNQKIHSRNSSGFKGVHWHKKQRQWVARITVKGKTIDLGGYNHREIAAQVYVEAAQHYHGAFARPETIDLFATAGVIQVAHSGFHSSYHP